MRSSYLSADDLASAHLGHTDDVAATVLERSPRRPGARVCVLPEGRRRSPTWRAVRGDRRAEHGPGRHVVGDRPRSAGGVPPLAGGPGPFVLGGTA